MARTLSMLAALALGFSLSAQGAPKAAPAAPAPSVATPEQSAQGGGGADDILAVVTVPYHPTLVRDPFATPSDADQSNRGDMVDDIAVKGRVISAGKTLAVISDARGNVRMVPLGFKFKDGELVSIDDKSVTFHQWDPTGTNQRVFRTVVKIYKREEAKR